MPAGLQVWDANSVLRVDTGDSFTRILGVINTGVNDGSIVDGNIAGGRFWYFCKKIQTTPGGYISPAVSVSGSTISWSFNNAAASLRVSNIIMYGLY